MDTGESAASGHEQGSESEFPEDEGMLLEPEDKKMDVEVSKQRPCSADSGNCFINDNEAIPSSLCRVSKRLVIAIIYVEVLDTRSVSHQFSFRLEEESYIRMFAEEGEGTKFRITATRDYTDVLADYFSKENPFCVLKFDKKKVNLETKSGYFFLAYARCKRQPCSSRWRFSIRTFKKKKKSRRVQVV